MDGSTSYHGNDRAIKTPSLNIFSTREEKDPNTSPFVGLMPADTHSSLPTTAAPRRRWHWNSVSFILGFQLVGVYVLLPNKDGLANFKQLSYQP
jgi:hypothetical protein